MNEIIQLGGPMMIHWLLQTLLFLFVIYKYIIYHIKIKNYKVLFNILLIQSIKLFYCALMVVIHFNNHQFKLKEYSIHSGNSISNEVIIEGLEQWAVFVKFEIVYIIIFFISIILIILQLKNIINKKFVQKSGR